MLRSTTDHTWIALWTVPPPRSSFPHPQSSLPHSLPPFLTHSLTEADYIHLFGTVKLVCVNEGSLFKKHQIYKKGVDWDGNGVCVCVCVSWHGGYLARARVLFEKERVFSIVSQLNNRSEMNGGGGELAAHNTAPLVVPHSQYLLWPKTHPCSPLIVSMTIHTHTHTYFSLFEYINFLCSSLIFWPLTLKPNMDIDFK